MANPEHLEILRHGVDHWNAWRKKDDTAPDLRDASLSGANLIGVDFSGADLTLASLDHALMGASNLHLAVLKKANLRDADARETIFRWADLEQAFLAGAYLRGANFLHANLRYVNLTGAIIGELILVDTDMSGAQGLLTCRHYGPSTVDHRTIQRSDSVPIDFLRRCGLPEGMIPPLLNSKNEPSCFLSYSTKDQDFAERLYRDLQAGGIRCWFAPHDIRGGAKLEGQIQKAIHDNQRVLLLLSEHSMNSEWVKTEIAFARRRELNEGRQVLFPISLAPFEVIRAWRCFDADIGKDSAREIREYFVPDFSKWRIEEVYRPALDRLLHNLKV